MTQPLHPGSHLDADQLTAFAEGVLPDFERQQALAHLAECSDCRRIVFLAQEPLPTPVTSPVAEPFWHRWFGPVVLAGAAAAVAALVLVSLNPHHPSPLPTQNDAANRTPAPPPLNASANNAPLPPPPKRAPEPPPQVSAKELHAIAPPIVAGTPNASPTPLPRVDDSASMADKAAPSADVRARSSVSGYIASAPAASTGVPLAIPAPAPPPPSPAPQSNQQPQYANRNPAFGGIESKAKEARRTTTASVAQKSAAPASDAAPGTFNFHIQPNQTPTDAFSAINGSVTDPSGATVSGAVITLRQLPGSATTQTATNAAGQFNIPTLPAGQYEMQIASPGFQSQTRQIELQSRDLAQLDSKLSLGAVGQTVEVAAASNQIATENAVFNDVIADREATLPGKRKAVITVASGTTVLALDADGKLYRRSSAGRRWKTVPPSWSGKVVQLSLTPTSKSNVTDFSQAAPLPPSSTSTAIFRLTTISGSVWVSSDGEHWRAK